MRQRSIAASASSSLTGVGSGGMRMVAEDNTTLSSSSSSTTSTPNRPLARKTTARQRRAATTTTTTTTSSTTLSSHQTTSTTSPPHSAAAASPVSPFGGSGYQMRKSWDRASFQHGGGDDTAHAEEEGSFVTGAGSSSRGGGGGGVTFYSYQRSVSSQDLQQRQVLSYQRHHLHASSSSSSSPPPSSSPKSGGLLLEAYSTASSLSSYFQEGRQQRQQYHQSLNSSSSLQDVHVLYRTAHHVADANYASYVLGHGAVKRKNAVIIFTKPCCASTCMGFSIVAFVFLTWVGIMFDTQPLLIKGALPQHILSSTLPDDDRQQDRFRGKPLVLYKLPGPGERLPQAISAYRAAFAYLLCVVVCWHILHPQHFQKFKRRVQQQWRKATRGAGGGYQNMDQLPHHLQPEDSLLPKNSPSIGMDGTTNTNNSNSSAARRSHLHHPRSWWNQWMLLTRNWLAARGWNVASGAGSGLLPTTVAPSSKKRHRRYGTKIT